jgi:DNA polymerase sigma
MKQWRQFVGKQRGSSAGPMEQLDCNLGLLLIDYLRFYGRHLKYQEIGVTSAQHGRCYVKNSEGFGRDFRDRGDRYSIQDPLDASNDVAR